MEMLLLALTIGVPVIKIVMFPTRTIGRGGNWTILGAAMIVAMMMALWFGVQSFSDTAASAASPTTAGQAAQLPDLDSLSQLF